MRQRRAISRCSILRLMKFRSSLWIVYWIGCLLVGLYIGYLSAVMPASNTQTKVPVQEPVVKDLLQSPAPKVTTLFFAGDVMLGRSVGYSIFQNQDPHWPFIYVADLMKSADITYVNLENPMIANCPLTQSGMKFCSDVKNVAGLLYAGIDIVSLANNHATNYGIEGLNESIESLSTNNIEVVGLGKPVKIIKNDQIFTYLSFNDIGPYPGIANVDPTTLKTEISKHHVETEVLILTFHWGHEYKSEPSARQIDLAHQAIEAGADLVIGAHPHWVQSKEIYQGKPIYYSLGNFVFDQEWSMETKKGLALRFTFQGSNIVKTEELPVLIENYGQPKFE